MEWPHINVRSQGKLCDSLSGRNFPTLCPLRRHRRAGRNRRKVGRKEIWTGPFLRTNREKPTALSAFRKHAERVRSINGWPPPDSLRRVIPRILPRFAGRNARRVSRYGRFSLQARRITTNSNEQ